MDEMMEFAKNYFSGLSKKEKRELLHNFLDILSHREKEEVLELVLSEFAGDERMLKKIESLLEKGDKQ